jgi:hypothetical protein
VEERNLRECFAPALPQHSCNCNCKLRLVAMDNSSPVTKSYNLHPTDRKKKKKDSHRELVGDGTSSSPISNSNLRLGKFRLVGVRLFCSKSEDGGAVELHVVVVVFLDSETDSLGDVGGGFVNEFSLLRVPTLPQRELIILLLTTYPEAQTNPLAIIFSSLKQREMKYSG